MALSQGCSISIHLRGSEQCRLDSMRFNLTKDLGKLVKPGNGGAP